MNTNTNNSTMVNNFINNLTRNQRISLQSLILSGKGETIELVQSKFVSFKTSNAKDCLDSNLLNPRGLGAIFAGIGKRSDKFENDTLVYIKDFNKSNIIAISEDSLNDYVVWANNYNPNEDVEPVKEKKPRTKKEKPQTIKEDTTKPFFANDEDYNERFVVDEEVVSEIKEDEKILSVYDMIGYNYSQQI